MSDIVVRLRKATTATGMYGACHEAANEIERLRAECLRLQHAEAEAMAVVLSLEGQIEKLRGQLDQ